MLYNIYLHSTHYEILPLSSISAFPLAILCPFKQNERSHSMLTYEKKYYRFNHRHDMVPVPNTRYNENHQKVIWRPLWYFSLVSLPVSLYS